MRTFPITALLLAVSFFARANSDVSCRVTNVYESSHITVREEKQNLIVRYQGDGWGLRYPDLTTPFTNAGAIEAKDELVEVEFIFPRKSAKVDAKNKNLIYATSINTPVIVRVDDTQNYPATWNIERSVSLHWATFNLERIIHETAQGNTTTYFGNLDFYVNGANDITKIRRKLDCQP